MKSGRIAEVTLDGEFARDLRILFESMEDAVKKAIGKSDLGYLVQKVTIQTEVMKPTPPADIELKFKVENLPTFNPAPKSIVKPK